jgi:hypothetical protein
MIFTKKLQKQPQNENMEELFNILNSEYNRFNNLDDLDGIEATIHRIKALELDIKRCLRNYRKDIEYAHNQN